MIKTPYFLIKIASFIIFFVFECLIPFTFEILNVIKFFFISFLIDLSFFPSVMRARNL